jgi:RNA polymerase sigma-70 factor (ECF subfamily)
MRGRDSKGRNSRNNHVAEPVQLAPHQWVVRHADFLYGYALSRIDDEEQARELVQETFLAALEGLSRFKGESSERTWLTSILKYKVIDVYRKRNSGLRMEVAEAEREQQEYFDPVTGHWYEEYGPKELGVEDQDYLGNKELASILRKCLQKLPGLWFSVFTMKHIDDEPAETICKELKVTAANFWVIIHRAKVNLRACVQKNWI